MCSGTLESFFGDHNKKIQGLESEGVDLGTLAERLVNSTIYWLYQKHENGNNSQSETSAKKPDDACGAIVAVELTKLLLREPKDLINMHKSNDPSTQASDPRPTEIASENIVREYELQVLFRMEILQSEVWASVEEPMKQKFVKQICLHLEAIQCHLQGGFLVIGALIIMCKRSSKVGIVTLLAMWLIESVQKWTCYCLPMRMNPPIIYSIVKIVINPGEIDNMEM